MKKSYLLSAACGLAFLLISGHFASLRGEERTPGAKDQGQQKDVQDIIVLGPTRPVLLRLHVQVDGKGYQAVWDDFIKHLFQYLDTDKDGVLSKEEATRAPAPQTLFNSGGQFYVTTPGNANVPDVNKDGKVTLEELAGYYRRNGGAPFQFSQAANRSPYFRRGGFNDFNVGASGSADAINKALLAQLDTNKDGKLSKRELATAQISLRKQDLDDDEMVTSQEVMGEVAASGGEYAVFVDGYMAAAQPQDSPFVQITPGESSRTLARQLQSRYGPKKDQKGSTKLNREDLGLDEASFKQLDQDEDGQLDSEELANFANRAPDVEMMIQLGKTQSVDLIPGKKGSALAAQLRKEGGNVILDLGTMRVDLGNYQSGNAGMVRFANSSQIYKMQFGAADRDNNGYLDMEEAQRSGTFRNVFKLMDRDNDGKVFEKEMIAYFEAFQALQEKASQSCVTLNIADEGKGFFDLLDGNGDGRLSVRELRQAPKLVGSLDRNKDGQIALDEIPRRYQLSARRGSVNGGGGFRQVVVFSGYNSPSAPLPNPTEGPLWFRKMDRNRDSDISQREFLGSAELFKKIDTDSDGLISLEEAKRADAELRKSR